MKINTVKSKQIKNGVYVLHHGGEVVAANRRYALPPQSVVIPSNNMVIITTCRGDYVWQYVERQDVWRIWRISSDSIKDAIDSVKYKPFDMAVKKNEGDKALMIIQRNKKEKTRYKQEWRFYTKFFFDLVRK